MAKGMSRERDSVNKGNESRSGEGGKGDDFLSIWFIERSQGIVNTEN